MRELTRVAPEVRDRLAVRFGAGVLAWCDELPALVDELAARWGLDLVEAGGGGTSRVFRCSRRDTGASVWLKLTPDTSVAREEAEALRIWAGTPSVVTLLAEDLAVGALLLEHVEPRVPVRQLGWNLSDVAALLRDLRGLRDPRAAPPGAPAHSVLHPLSHRVDFLFGLTERRLSSAGATRVNGATGATRTTGMNGLDGLDASAVLAKAHSAALDLAASGPVGLVHGDLHPANVLSGPGARLVAIDPRPSWGDPDFDAVDWVLEGADGLATLERRIEKLAELVPGLSPDRVRAWCRSLAALVVVPAIAKGRDDAETRFLMALTLG